MMVTLSAWCLVEKLKIIKNKNGSGAKGLTLRIKWGAVVWWAYSSGISLTAPKIEGSNPGPSTSFIWTVNQLEAFFKAMEA